MTLHRKSEHEMDRLKELLKDLKIERHQLK